MLKRLSIFLLLLAGLLVSCQQSDPVLTESKLVWADEFNGDSLDLSKWEIQLGDGSDYGLWRWGNEEDQYYTANNVSVGGGFLRITSLAQSVGGYDYTSARIRTLEKADYKYGRVEASIKMPIVGGLWHAFWMLPSHPVDPWPISGEIDIMEYVGNLPDDLLQTIHFADRFGQRNQLGMATPFLMDNNFHTYAMEWDENQVIWFIDGTQTFSVLRSNDLISNTWPFDAQFHVLLNTAVGGNLGGAVDDQALQIPRSMEVDYVRIYQKI
jgi:beta-glucanase (GH16 family)